jgi:hypothetical protein
MNERVIITDPKHPHHNEVGVFSGKVITMIWGERMAEVKLDSCRHGTDACFVSPGQVSLVPVQKRGKR